MRQKMKKFGYDLTYQDFEQVLTDYMDAKKARKVFAKEIGVLAKFDGQSFQFFKPDGEPLSHKSIHELIQSNIKAQIAFYNFAMTNWH